MDQIVISETGATPRSISAARISVPDEVRVRIRQQLDPRSRYAPRPRDAT